MSCLLSDDVSYSCVRDGQVSTRDHSSSPAEVGTNRCCRFIIWIPSSLLYVGLLTSQVPAALSVMMLPGTVPCTTLRSPSVVAFAIDTQSFVAIGVFSK